MSISNIKNEKNNKAFKKADLLLYGIIIMVVAILFIVFVFVNNDEGLSGIEVYISDELVLAYDFSSDEFDYDNNSETIVIKNVADGYRVTLYEDEDKDHYNIILIDAKNKKITVEDANCSSSKDCMYMSIEKASDLIVCVPHNLIIKGVGEQEIGDPISG